MWIKLKKKDWISPHSTIIAVETKFLGNRFRQNSHLVAYSNVVTACDLWQIIPWLWLRAQSSGNLTKGHLKKNLVVGCGIIMHLCGQQDICWQLILWSMVIMQILFASKFFCGHCWDTDGMTLPITSLNSANIQMSTLNSWLSKYTSVFIC